MPHIFIALHTFRHSFEVIVVLYVDISKGADVVTRLDTSVCCRTTASHRIDLCKRRQDLLWHIVAGFELLRMGRRAAGVVGLHAGELLVDTLLDSGHQVFVVVAEMNDA